MPGLEDWINSPLQIIQDLFDPDDEKHASKIQEYFSKRIGDGSALTWIPSLNDVPLHNLKTNSVVRFRCMIQDMYDPEFYLGSYEVRDKNTGQTQMKSGKYKDIAECQAHQEILFESPKNVTMDRQTLYCVPVPGENEWVKQIYAKNSQAHCIPSTSKPQARNKRSIDDEDGGDDMTSAEETTSASNGDSAMDTEGPAESNAETKRIKSNETSGSSASVTTDLNFPLPGEKGPACIVKVYQNSDSYKLNEVIEFIGVLSNDPAMATFPQEKQNGHAEVDPVEDLMETEHAARCPPPSLVPRLHAVLAHRLPHDNPHLPTTDATGSKEMGEAILKEASDVREQVVSILEEALFGDRQAADVILCHLISSVYARRDVVAVGKFSVNLSGCPRDSQFATYLYQLLQQLVPKSHLLAMSLENMNTLPFVPKKDYTTNRLSSGILQLSDSTHLVVDETAMQAGQLDASGVKNLTALGNLVRWQKVDYDFSFHQQEFPTSIPVLVVSEGKSLVQCDCQVQLAPKCPTADLEQRFATIHSKLTASLIAKVRSYLTVMRQINYQLTPDMQKFIEEDFVEMRKEDVKNMTVDDFHSLLVLARLLSLSLGHTNLTRDVWELTKQMETQRKQKLPKSSSGSVGGLAASNIM